VAPVRRDLGSPDESYWDEYWDGVRLPAEVIRRRGAVYLSILEVFDRCLPKDPALSAAELGGSPDQYLAYVRRNLGYRVTSIDYSKIGCQKTIEKFRMLGIEGAVIEADIFGPLPTDPQYDVVWFLSLSSLRLQKIRGPNPPT